MRDDEFIGKLKLKKLKDEDAGADHLTEEPDHLLQGRGCCHKAAQRGKVAGADDIAVGILLPK